MVVLGWILRVLLVMFIIRVIVSALFPARTPAGTWRGPTRAPGPQERIGGELVRDPTCGTYIPKAGALAVGRGESMLYFCSPACRDAYVKAHA